MNQTIQQASRFFTSFEFRRAIFLAALFVVSSFLFYKIGFEAYIVGLCVGIFLTSINDLQGNFRHRTIAMFASILLNAFVLFSINILFYQALALACFVGIFSFVISYLAIYGMRASLFSLSGLLAIVMGFVRHYEFSQLPYHLLSFLFGGFLYWLCSTLYHYYTKQSQQLQSFGELAKLTAQYFQHRNDEHSKSDYIDFDLQVQINEKQEKLRDLIFSDRRKGGQSPTRNRYMLILIELIDLMELGLANQSTMNSVHQQFEEEPEWLEPFYTLSQILINRLYEIGDSFLDNNPKLSKQDFGPYFVSLNDSIEKYVTKKGLPQARLGALALRNYEDYLTNQYQNLNSLERLIVNMNAENRLRISKQEQKKFLTKEDYSPQIATDNFSIKSPIFRHALRLAIAMVVGFGIGKIFQIHNAYWILMTIVVILRPSYGLTRERSRQRIVGTIVGVIIAAVVFSITINSVAIFIFMMLSLIFAVATLSGNYTFAATAITLNVIFLFYLVDPNPWLVMSYRLLDTLIGAIICLLIGYFIFPNWEISSIRTALAQSIESNQELLSFLPIFYKDSKQLETEYRLKRKDAFINSSALNSSFQRFTNDPKSKQDHYSDFYELVALNQALLSSITNLGNFFKTHYDANLNDELQQAISQFNVELESTKKLLLQPTLEQQIVEQTPSTEIETKLDEKWRKLEQIREDQLAQGKQQIDKKFLHQLQEIRLIRDELAWMDSLILNMLQVSQMIQTKQ